MELVDEKVKEKRGEGGAANGVLDNAVWRAAGLPLLRDFRAPLAEVVARLG